MATTKEIEQALSTTGEWIDNSGTIKVVRVSPDYQWIDILGDQQGQGTFSDWVKKKRYFLNIRDKLPPGPYRLNADHPTKAALYKRWTKNDPLFKLSGETAKAKGIPGVFQTLTMQVHPKDASVDRNGLRDPQALDVEQGLPKTLNEAVERGLNVYEDTETGKTWKLRYKSRVKPTVINDNEYKLEREGWDTRKAGHRKHHHKIRALERGKLLTKQDYYDYAEANNISLDIADQKYNQNQLRLKSRQLRSGKDTPWIVEHLNPQANPEGGVEHWRNNVLWTDEVNHPKSDIIPSEDALRRAGVPLNKQEALALDFAGDKGVPTKEARRIILEDIQNQIDTGTTIRARNLRNIGGLARATSGADAAIQLASGNVVGGSLGLALQTPAVQKAIMKRLAKSGAKLAPGVGFGLSALEAGGYVSQGRWTQAGIAGLSGIVGEVPLVGDLISAGLDLTNTGIDLATGNINPDIDEDTLYRNIGRKPRI